MRPEDRKAWRSALEAFAPNVDIFQTPEYASLLEAAYGFLPTLLHLRGPDYAAALPLVLRPVDPLPLAGARPGLWDFETPWFFSGPLVQGDIEKARTALQERLASWAESEDVVAGFVRFHPLLFNDTGWPATSETGQVVVIDLEKPLEEIREGYAKPCRNAIAGAERKGVKVTRSEDPSSVTAFMYLYDKVMQEKRAPARYHFPRKFWSAFETYMRGHWTVFEAWHKDVRIASSVVLHEGRYASDWLRVQEPEARGLNASNLLVDEEIAWCSEARGRGIEILQLGGGRVGAKDGQFAFKRSFGGEVYPYRTAGYVFLDDAYANLVQRRRELDAAPPVKEDFFPLYRSGLAEE